MMNNYKNNYSKLKNFKMLKVDIKVQKILKQTGKMF